MKRIGYNDQRDVIVELSEREFNAIKALIDACGDSVYKHDDFGRDVSFGDIADWVDAVYKFCYVQRVGNSLERIVDRIKDLRNSKIG